MHTQFSYKQISEKDKKFLENYIDKKIERIKTLLNEKDFENGLLKIRSEKFAKKQAYKVEIHLILPGKFFLASEDDHTIIEAFDLALDKLIIQLRRYQDEIKGK